MPHRLDTDKQIFFYENEFYPLSNFSAFRVDWQGIDFDTAEHAYHWAKFDSRELKEHILASRSAHDAFAFAQQNAKHIRGDWYLIIDGCQKRISVMRNILYTKLQQHEYVRRKLLETGSRKLVEDSWRDDFWGIGPNGDGQNWMGRLWMEIRD
jgi:ribA/ribD-fused uncharacterized protein